VVRIHRVGKRIVLELDGDLFLVIHLMVAGRLKWLDRGAKVPGKVGLAAIDFPYGTLILTEAATKKRASLHFVRGMDAVRAMDRGGIEVLDAPLAAFRQALLRENHTLKRSLTDPRLFSGVGNAYSDEILHAPACPGADHAQAFRGGDRAAPPRDAGGAPGVDRAPARRDRRGFPEKVTAFREGMAVHGRYRKPCPVCGTAVQRIAYADNETNYCPRCQTEGRILSDRSLSRLLKSDWPGTSTSWRRSSQPGAETRR